MHPKSDRTLWDEARSGNKDAFGVLFERHGQRIYNHCFRRTSNWQLAEDLTSVVFLEAWRKRDTVFVTTDSILPWLLAVATNVCRNSRRSVHRYRKALAAMPPPDSVEFEADAAARMDAQTEMKIITEQLKVLSPADREVLMLCVWEGLNAAAAGLVLGQQSSTVRSRLSRARSRLSSLVQRQARPEHEQSEHRTVLRPLEER